MTMPLICLKTVPYQLLHLSLRKNYLQRYKPLLLQLESIRQQYSSSIQAKHSPNSDLSRLIILSSNNKISSSNHNYKKHISLPHLICQSRHFSSTSYLASSLTNNELNSLSTTANSSNLDPTNTLVAHDGTTPIAEAASAISSGGASHIADVADTLSVVNKGIAASTTAAGDVVTHASNIAASSPDLYGWLATYMSMFQSVACSAPVIQLMSLLRGIHDTTGLPWWLSIMVATVMLRTAVTFPLAVYQQYIAARLELLRHEFMGVMQTISMQTKRAKQEYNWDEPTAKMYFKKESGRAWKELILRDNCHPAKGVVMVLGQLPLWLMVSISLRNLTTGRPFADQVAVESFLQLSQEGLWWFSNLTVPDAFCLVPVTMTLINLAVTEVNVMQRRQDVTGLWKKLPYVFRGVAIITLPIAIYMPSGVVLYWATSSTCALLQTLVLLHPSVKSACGVPVTPSLQLHPYSRMMAVMKDRFTGSNLHTAFDPDVPNPYADKMRARQREENAAAAVKQTTEKKKSRLMK